MTLIQRRPRLCVGLALAVGLALGWATGPARSPLLFASGADRWQDRVLASGPISVETNKMKMQVTQDAVYYLNYHNGLLLASVPTYRQTPGGAEILTDFAERDLVKDFDLKPGSNPRFLMTTASLGVRSEGWAPLFVFETESGQVASYRVAPQVTTGTSRPQFQLLERRTDPRLARAMAATIEAR
jgi:hypothetical protein